MSTLSDPTLGQLIIVAGEYEYTPTELGALLLRADLARYGDGSRSGDKVEMLASALLGARTAAEAGDQRAHRGLLRFVCLFVKMSVGNSNDLPWVRDLMESLLADGYELRRVGDLLPNSQSGYELVPTDAGPVPLAAEISALERELDSRGYRVALNHYRQATTAFVQRDYEACNGMLRSALEDLVVQLATKHTGYVRPARQGGGGPAIDNLKTTANLAARDGGDLVKGLWAMASTSGSHPGISNADETRFRLQVVTASARLLLHRFP